MHAEKQVKRTPKGRVLYAITHDNDLCDHLGEFDIRETKREAFDFVRYDEAVYPVAVIPCATVKQARAVVKMLANGEVLRVLRMAALSLDAIPIARDSGYWKFRANKVKEIEALLANLHTP